VTNPLTTDTTVLRSAAETDADGTAEAQSAPRSGFLTRARRGVRRWRRSRPFWGGLVLIAGGYFVMDPILGGSWKFFVQTGVSAFVPALLGGVMVAAAVIAIVKPAQRHFPAIIAMMCSVASLPLANLGGWIIGMLLGIIGSGLVFAWTPYSDKQLAKLADKAERKQQRKDARAALRTGKQTATAA